MRGEQHGGGALRGVEQQRQRGEPLAARAQHVGRADIAGADLAQIAEPGELGEDQAERDRAEQIAAGKSQQGEDRGRHSNRRGDIDHPSQEDAAKARLSA